MDHLSHSQTLTMEATYSFNSQFSILSQPNSQSSTTQTRPYCQLRGQREPDEESDQEGTMSSFVEREVAALPVGIEE